MGITATGMTCVTPKRTPMLTTPTSGAPIRPSAGIHRGSIRWRHNNQAMTTVLIGLMKPGPTANVQSCTR